jgi:phage terminase small subunit
MSRHRNYRHEKFAQALAEGKSRAEAMIVAGYKSHRGNQNRLAQLPDVVARVEEIRKHSDEIVDLRKIDRGRLLIELARIACADAPLRAAIAQAGPEALQPDQPVLLVTIRLDGVFAKPIEMRLLDDRGALTALMRCDNAADRKPSVDFSPAIPADFGNLEQALRRLLADRELHSSRSNSCHCVHEARPGRIAYGPVAGDAIGSQT